MLKLKPNDKDSFSTESFKMWKRWVRISDIFYFISYLTIRAIPGQSSLPENYPRMTISPDPFPNPNSFPDGIIRRVCPKGILPVENCSGGNCPEGSCQTGNFSVGEGEGIVKGTLPRGGGCPVAICAIVMKSIEPTETKKDIHTIHQRSNQTLRVQIGFSFLSCTKIISGFILFLLMLKHE